MAFAILLNEMVDLPMLEVAPIIAQAENIIYADATRALRDPTGFLAQNLPYNEAENICSQLNNVGIGCFVMDMARMYHPPDYQAVNTAVLQEDGLFVTDYYGGIIGMDWGDFVYMAVGRILPHKKESYTLGSSAEFDLEIRHTFTSPMSSMGGYVPADKGRKKEPSTTKRRDMVDLFFRSPNEAHLRVFSDGFNYGYLGQRIGMSSTQNFRLLVEDIVRFAPHVFGNRGTSSLLGNSPPRHMEYKNERIFDEENLWMLQIVYLNLNQQ